MEKIKKYKSQILSVTFLFSVGLLFLYSLSALWLQRVVYAPGTFSDITIAALQEETSRESIADAITAKVFEDKPLAKEIVGPNFSSLVQGVLRTDVAAAMVDGVAKQVREVLVSEDIDSVAINILPIKSSLQQLKNVANFDRIEQIEIADIPEEIVLVDLSSVKPVYDAGVYLVWVGPLAFVLSLGGMVWWVYRDRKTAIKSRLRQVSIVLVAVGLLGGTLGPITKPAFVTFASSAEAQTLLGSMYVSLLQPFTETAILVFIIGGALFMSTFTRGAFLNERKTKKTNKK